MIADYNLIPRATLETLQAWISSARPMGSFCEAIVSNNLREACAQADDCNIRELWHTVAWMYNCAPIGSWGSPNALKQWLEFIRESKGRTNEENEQA